jgi:ribonuclease P protein component
VPARQHRITRGEDFRRIVRTGNRVGGKSCIIHAVIRVPADSPARFGYIVTKSVGNAVTRNRVRRRLQAISQSHLRRGLTGVDVVFRVLPAAQHLTYSELCNDVEALFARISQNSQKVSM